MHQHPWAAQNGALSCACPLSPGTAPNLTLLSRRCIITWSSALCTFGGGNGTSGCRRPGFEGRGPSCPEAARNAPTPRKCQARQNSIALRPCLGEADRLIYVWRKPPHGGAGHAKGDVVDLSARPIGAGITNGWGSSADARKRAGLRPSARAYPMGWVSGPRKTVSVGCRRLLRAGGRGENRRFLAEKGWFAHGKNFPLRLTSGKSVLYY